MHAPIQGVVRSLDPSLIVTVEQAEALPCVYETLTWAVEGTRIIPWLASEVLMENGGTRYRFRLQSGVRFHNGRRLTARDVRHSWERLLLNKESESRWVLGVIQGASRLLDGQATDLSGFHILSPGEFTVDLEKPVPFFPAMISYAATAIVPEGTAAIGRSPREDAIGTGPFRLVSFEPGRRLELERNPNYWRAGRPRSDGVVFHFGVPPEEIRNEFLAGPALDRARPAARRRRGLPARSALRFGLPREPAPDDVLRRLQRPPGALSGRRGAARPRPGDPRRRPRAADARPPRDPRPWPAAAGPARVLGRRAELRPRRLRPPRAGRQLGGSHRLARVRSTSPRPSIPSSSANSPTSSRSLDEAFRDAGLRIRPVNKTMAEYLQHSDAGDVDLDVGRWTADYPDSDTFFFGALHSASGAFRNIVGNAEIDRLSEQARVETDPRVRHSLYRQAEELIAREALMLPLFHDQVYCFARPELEGLTAIGQSNSTIAYEDLWIRR